MSKISITFNSTIKPPLYRQVGSIPQNTFFVADYIKANANPIPENPDLYFKGSERCYNLRTGLAYHNDWHAVNCREVNVDITVKVPR